MEVKRLALVLADISGYTQFVNRHKMSLLHAEQIITDLLEAVIDQAEYPLQVSKLEGDAVFVKGLDVLDNTPLLDIKPYVPGFDHHPVTRIGWLEGQEDTRPWEARHR